MFPRDENGKLIYSDVDYLETWEGMVECQKRGLAKSIGVSNFEIKHLERLMANSNVKPAVNQVECHPYYNQKDLLAFCQKHDILMEAYAPLGAPYITAGFHGFAPKQVTVTVLTDPILADIGNKYDKTPAQVALRWAVQRGTVPLPRSNNKSRLSQNFSVFDFKLTDEEMNTIDGLHQNIRAYDKSAFKDHPHFAA